MDAGSSSSKKPKRKFAPRAPPPPRRSTGPPTTTATDADDEERTALMIASNYAIGRVKPKADKKASAEVAFQRTSITHPIVPVSVPKDDDKSSDPNLEPSLSGNVPVVVSSVSDQKDGGEETLTLDDDDDALVPKSKNDYVEPWDHHNPYSPITLPLRKPPSGDPELRDKEEFGEVARYADYDENAINSAKELGLTSDEHGKEKMIFFQLPGPLPVKKQTTDPNNEDNTQRRSAFDGLQKGFMGKMRVYKSGAVKLKLGDVLFDVSPGPNTNFSNTVAAIDTRKKQFCNLGSTEKIATVTPDIDALLSSEADMVMETKR